MTSASPSPVGILFPMEFEAEPTWKRLGGKSRPEDGLETLHGNWKGLPVVSARIGMGHAGLEKKVEGWLENHPCRAVILAGLAGALDPDWDEGDLSSFHAESWPEFAVWARSKPAVRTGKWHTAHEIIETGLAKLELGKKTGCGLVEMEWDYVAEGCRKRGVPLVGLRAVSDHADKLLPADLFLLGCDATTGKSTPVKIGLHLALRPWRLRELIPAVGGCMHAREVMSKALGDYFDWMAEKSS
jgi:nucleoside phosphorylase